MILNGILFLFCVFFSLVGIISLLFGAWPMTIFCALFFSLCYKGIHYNYYNGPAPKQIHLTYFNGDSDGGEDGGEDEIIPFNRDNFKFN